MNGQWVGNYSGSSNGTIILNIDEMTSYFQGTAYLLARTEILLGTVVLFKTQDKNNNFQFRTNFILPINPQTGSVDKWDNVKQFYPPDTRIPGYADIEGNLDDTGLSLTWTTDIQTSGNCQLPHSKAGEPSELLPINKEWLSYKDYVASLEGRRYLFRGQNKPWRLRTSFHRAGRANLVRFLNEDIQMLHKQLSARTKHVFNLQNPDENGAFFNLVQHHGYPTPLLDWTYSPYVAAFFAYRGIYKETAQTANPDEKVRILVFDQAQWRTDFNQVLNSASPGLHVSIGEFMAIENERMIPQQAASMVTNIDDIESYIKSKESDEKKYLWAIDLPINDRNKVIEELRYMGITAGSMFPGLDGACEELKERNFEI